MAFRVKPRNFYRLLRHPPLEALQRALRSWRYRCPKCPQMPPDLREEFVARTNEAAVIQWYQQNSEPCPHGASLEEVRSLIWLPVRRKLPKHVRAYLEEAIAKGIVSVVVTEQGIRYLAKQW